MSSSMKRAEMEHVNPSFQKIMKRGIVRDNLILEELFFLFDLSRIYLPGMNLNDEHNTWGLQAGQHNRCVLNTRFTKYFRNNGESYYARRNPENKKRPVKRAEAKNRAWIYPDAGQHHGDHTGTRDHPYWRTRAGRYRQSGETTVWLTTHHGPDFFQIRFFLLIKTDPKKIRRCPLIHGQE